MGYYKDLLLEAEELDINLGYDYDIETLDGIEGKINDE